MSDHNVAADGSFWRGCREAEEALRAQVQSDFMRRVDISGPYYWVTGHVQWFEASSGVHIERVSLRGSYPWTQLAIEFTCFRDEGYRDCRFAWLFPIWRRDHQPLSAPNADFMDIVFHEDLHKGFPRPWECVPGVITDLG